MTLPSFNDILSRWPDRQAVYEDAKAGDPSLKPIAVYRWEKRGMIPPRHWAALIEGAKRRKIALKPAELMNARQHTDRSGHSSDEVQGGSA